MIKESQKNEFGKQHKEFIYKTLEGKLIISDKVSSINIAVKFKEEFDESISYSYICKLLLNKYGRPYRGINSVLLTEEHLAQRVLFAEDIIQNKITSSDIMFKDE